MAQNKKQTPLFHEVAAARSLRERFLADWHRPGYHFVTPEDIGWPGDPNGIFYARGRYHMMYLYDNCTDSFRWGHLSSIDMIHWRSHPDMLIPDEVDGGIFSGGAFVDENETAWISYWALPRDGENFGGVRLAKSSDRHYDVWEKQPGYIIRSDEYGVTRVIGPNGEETLVGSADPSNLWKCGEYCYIQTGNLPVLNKYRDNPDAPEKYRGDHAYLFRSKDMKSWEYCHEFYQRDIANCDTDPSEDNMCPCFLPLPSEKDGGALSDTYLELFISHNKGCQYYLGDYDKEKQFFTQKVHGRMSWVDNGFFAPEAVVTPDNRLVMWSWLLDEPETDEDSKRGWSGVYGIPRQLWRSPDGTLGIAPLKELERLRYAPTNKIEELNEAVQSLNSDMLHLKLTVDMKDAYQFILRLYEDKTGRTNNKTILSYSTVTGELTLKL